MVVLGGVVLVVVVGVVMEVVVWIGLVVTGVTLPGNCCRSCRRRSGGRPACCGCRCCWGVWSWWPSFMMNVMSGVVGDDGDPVVGEVVLLLLPVVEGVVLLLSLLGEVTGSHGIALWVSSGRPLRHSSRSLARV